MKHLPKTLSTLLFSLFSASLTYGGVESEHLKLYASFDDTVKPEIALNGAGLRDSGKMIYTEGQFGKALHFSQKSDCGDLWYNLGKDLLGEEWSISFWLKLDEPLKYGGKGASRQLFRTNFGWETGNVYGGFDNWGHFLFTHLDGKKYAGATMPNAGFTAKQWVHLTFGYKNGKHTVYINGIEAAYTQNTDSASPGMKQDVLRIGSMDFRSRDQINGAIDELKVFDKLLSAEEAKEIMNSIPGKKQQTVLLFVPFEGEVDPVGAASFNASELLFTKGKSGEGVKVVRHGYDRKGSLNLNGVKGLGDSAVSIAFWFIPDWNGATETSVHGLYHANVGSLKYSLAFEDKKLTFTLDSNGKKQKLSLNAASLKKGSAARLCAGFDFKTKKMYVAINDKIAQDTLNLPYSNGKTDGVLIVGDVSGSDTYSKTQSEGVIDELLAVSAFLLPNELAKIQERESGKFSSTQKGTLPVSAVKELEKKLWSFDGAEKTITATRETVTLNALWRMQLTNNELKFDPSTWIYLAVPGRYSGQGNGLTDCEFYMRDANLKKLPRNSLYKGVNPYSITNAYFERAFLPPKTWQGKQIVLQLDELSSSQRGVVYLNGKEIAKLAQGRYFEIPVNPAFLKFGEYNYLTIHTIDNGQYWAWRGIKGDTRMEVKPMITAEFPGIVTSVKNGTITFDATLENKSAKPETVYLEAKISGASAPAPFRSTSYRLQPGESKTITFTAPWKNASLWSPDTPVLYHCLFSLKNEQNKLIDELPPLRFGFREFEIRGKDYYLNGNRIHLFNHDGWANSSSDINEARRVARTMKKLGLNAVRTNFPVEAKDNYPENIMKVCDEEGLLQLVGIDGVTGREFVLWNNPETRKNLERKMASMIRKWRNHPSNIMYFMSTNFLGYGWDYHPLKMADGYQPAFQQNKYKTCMEGVKIMRKYDSSRPFFFQAGGNFGDIITNNAYFCWWPQTERNAWPEEWSKIGKKPLHIIETGFPLVWSFAGMDLKYSGAKPLFYYENLARYYGPSVYLDNDPEMSRSTELSTQDKNVEIYYDAPLYQKLKSDLLKETISYWRGFGMSGICPFAEILYAYRKNAPHRSQHVAKSWEVEPKEFRRIGWSPDLQKLQYQSDINPDEPLPVAHAFRDALAPKLIFIDGGEKEPVDQTHLYYSGSTLEKRIVLINDSPKKENFKIRWTLADRSGELNATLEPGGIRHLPLKLSLPSVTKRTELPLTVTALKPDGVKSASMNITVFPAVKPALSGRIALYDTVGLSAKTLKEMNIKTENASALNSLNGIRLLIIGRESLTPEFMSIAKRLHLKDAVDSGKLNVIVLEQKPEGLGLLGLRAMPIYARNVFPGSGFSPAGLQGSDFSNWSGNGTLAPSKPLPTKNTEENVASPLWHWNNANIVSSYPARRPVNGDFKIFLSCGKDLIYTPLFELKSGKGKILFCQLEISGRTQKDPAAEHLLSSLVGDYSAMNRGIPASELLAPEKLTEQDVAPLMRKVADGATLIVPANHFGLFGLQSKTEKVGRFTITEAGRKYWPLLTARDTWLRAPQKLQILSGKDLIPLTTPAFCGELRHGKGRIIFLEFPSMPQQSELARGLKQGMDSSIVWSAEILGDRFRQLRTLLESSLGKGELSLASRFEKMNVPNRYLDLNGTWEFRTDPGKKVLSEGWAKSSSFSTHTGWEPIVVPGYFNNLLPHVGIFVGHVWYRKTITLPSDLRGQTLYLDFGSIDDLDTTYVNGVKVGETGEDTEGYWCARRHYKISGDLTRGGILHIAVCVNNLRGNGGIMDYGRVLVPKGEDKLDLYPYRGLGGTYNTETHIRW